MPASLFIYPQRRDDMIEESIGDANPSRSVTTEFLHSNFPAAFPERSVASKCVSRSEELSARPETVSRQVHSLCMASRGGARITRWFAHHIYAHWDISPPILAPPPPPPPPPPLAAS